MDYRFEALVLPVSDVDRAKEFYVERAGFGLDVDHRRDESFRVVQISPPGSPASVIFGVGIGASTAGPVIGLHLVVTDISAAVDELSARGVPVSPVRHMTDRGWAEGADPEHTDYNSFSEFADPDGNTWVLQERGHPGTAG